MTVPNSLSLYLSVFSIRSKMMDYTLNDKEGNSKPFKIEIIPEDFKMPGLRTTNGIPVTKVHVEVLGNRSPLLKTLQEKYSFLKV